MGYDIDILLKTDLYKDLSMEQLKSITDKNYGQFKSYKKNDRIFNEGDKPSRILMLVEGSVTIARETYTGGRVLITALTKKMAEDLTEYLESMDIKVRYMHHDIDTIERMEIIRSLRLGEFDVLVGINLCRKQREYSKE